MSDRFANNAGAFIIDPLPSQPQLAICHGFFVSHAQRGKGLAHQLKQEQNELLRALNYDAAICTVDGANEVQKKVLTKAGWKHLLSFRNRKTGGRTELWGCHVG